MKAIKRCKLYFTRHASYLAFLCGYSCCFGKDKNLLSETLVLSHTLSITIKKYSFFLFLYLELSLVSLTSKIHCLSCCPFVTRSFIMTVVLLYFIFFCWILLLDYIIYLMEKCCYMKSNHSYNSIYRKPYLKLSTCGTSLPKT